MNRVRIRRLHELAEQRRRFGYRRLHILLREGIRLNHALSHLSLERLTVRKRGGPSGRSARVPRCCSPNRNQRWLSISSRMHWPTAGGSASWRWWTTSAASASPSVDTSLSGVRVARELDRIVELRGRPRMRSATTAPSSPHAIALAAGTRRWLDYIAPGKPMQNGFVERRPPARRVPQRNLFAGLAEARRIIAEWRYDGNTTRPHTSLDRLTAQQFAAR